MNKKLLTRLLCALLSVLMLVCMIPAMTVSASTSTTMTPEELKEYVATPYANAEERLAAMEPVYSNGTYTLYCDIALGDVAYKNNKTGEVLFTNPWNAGQSTAGEAVYNTMMSQITLTYEDSTGTEQPVYYSYTDAALKNQLSVTPIKNGIRVEYAIGDRSARTLIPRMIEREAFETKILAPLAENTGGRGSSEYQRLSAYFTSIYYATYMNQGKTQMAEDMATIYPVVKEKGIDMYVLQSNIGTKAMENIESWISKYCPEYTFEEMDNDHEYVGYEEESISPPVFDVALEYTLDANGLVVTLPAKGLRYDETAYRITDFTVLPYMGASLATNQGYTFLPDGSGALFAIDEPLAAYSQRVYGEDFSLGENISGAHNSVIRMPVFGQKEDVVVTDEEGNVVDEYQRGFLAIIEEGESLAYLRANHKASASNSYSTVYPAFVTRQNDEAVSGTKGWSIYANRRYTDDYQIRYIMLTDDEKAAKAELTSYYECSWMGMAVAYRDYLDANAEGFDRLTAETTEKDIPLYIETFGCMDSIEKVLSMPVTVSVPLTSFEDVAAMYDYLAGAGISNVDFKLTGYANGGMYADVPYKLKWEKAVGGSDGFETLSAYAAEKGFELYPDFDFVYTSQAEGGSKVNMKHNAARTIENRYTSRRVYSATQQSMVSYYQMVLAPATYSKFYEKLGERYAKFENATGISLETFGNSLNADYDEDKTVLREEAKQYVLEALAYFGESYDVMLDEANAYTWRYADHILNIPLDSSRYNYEQNTIPFMGVVLHGYVQFAGSPLNMEGDLKYAMLKAMENGASVYFVLSYANTELLKEDILLSQNYSVRYDIWQSRLVDIYHEINAVLFDVQNKLIVGHEFLNGERVPDEDELLEDIAKEAEDLANKIKEEIEAEYLETVSKRQQARNTAVNAAGNINALMNYLDLMDYERASAKRDQEGVTYPNAKYPPKSLVKEWSSFERAIDKDWLDDAAISTFYDAVKNSVVGRKINMEKNVLSAAQYYVDAVVAHHYLKEIDKANAALVQMAAVGVADAKVAFAKLMQVYFGCEIAVGLSDSDLIAAAEEARVEALLGSVAPVAGATQKWIARYDAENDVIVYAPGCDATTLKNYIFGGYDVFDADGNVIPNDLYGTKVEGGVNYQIFSYGSQLGLNAVYDAYVAMLELAAEEREDFDKIDVAQMEAELTASTDNSGIIDDSDDTANTEDEVVVNNKYMPDGDIVLVTYGEPGQKFGDKGTKSLILNFNDYAVRTTLANGVTYTVEAYGYVVIYS